VGRGVAVEVGSGVGVLVGGILVGVSVGGAVVLMGVAFAAPEHAVKVSANRLIMKSENNFLFIGLLHRKINF
jgi:hypothetical protein